MLPMLQTIPHSSLRTLLPRHQECGYPLRRRRDGVHGVEEGQTLRCQVEVLRIELPAKQAMHALPVPGDPGRLRCRTSSAASAMSRRLQPLRRGKKSASGTG